MKLRVILADDHKVVRDSFRIILKKDDSIEVVGEADTGKIAVNLALKLKPDIILMDVSMPDLNGIEATRQIICELPEVKVIAVSVYSNRSFVTGMLDAGARGYILKDYVYDDLINAIHEVDKNKIYLSPQIANYTD